MPSQDALQRQRDWESRYHGGSTGWDRGGVSPALESWLATNALQRGRVLVPGCGNGYEVLALAREGYAVTAVDIAAQPVIRLTGALVEQGLHARVVQADLLHWTPSEPFDLIYEQTCLCALDPALWQDYADRLASWLLPGGRLWALFMQTGRTGGPPFHCDMTRMHELFPEALWVWPPGQPGEVAHPNGLRELAHQLIRRGGGSD